MKKHDFFAAKARDGWALTFEDVLLRTGYSTTRPSDVSVETRFSRRISLKIPIISAAMDTVTEHKMAITMAMLGGIGVIHKKMSPEEQAKQVKRVKFYLHGRIDRPITVSPQDTVESILRRREEKAYAFHSFPVVDQEGRLQGVITGNDLKYRNTDVLQTAADIMATVLVTAPPETSVPEAYTLLQKEKRGVLPLVDEECRLVGMYVYSDLHRIMHGDASTCNLDSQNRLRVAAAVGVGKDAVERGRMLAEAGVDAIVIDTAHGHTDEMSMAVLSLRNLDALEGIDIVVGNVSQPTAVAALMATTFRNRIDAIKVGQGPGSICTTRVVTGAGRPQLTAVYECAQEAQHYGIPVIADGGIRYSGDIAKVLAAGAESVMLGGILAGTTDAPGEIVLHQGLQKKFYRGMGSLGVMEESQSAAARYRQGDVPGGKLVPEGIEGVVPYKGDVANVLHQLIGGLRAGMGYVGAISIAELYEKGEFEHITGAGSQESHPHDVEMSRDAPNYQRR